ncbi:excinulease of nucleotide excision repair, DNA damage recognition component [Methylacidimicrobium sp. AP8]|uniref:excinuclease ABC subunit UvrB n=1 Tax=Methylacidimicrobium sp. AP8 TaxID=2730359 RepID=UPI0018BFDE7F|nr:excinuclease ABC subunit UvrB [Methylacidimicrobium sp. AP8]CAB4243153.1 excinulease of nucleotide excision repair, DNA damage recognition component [Methylacidimicrobium sp. AP8]
MSTEKAGGLFRLRAPYAPCGDQPQAIEAIVRRIQEGQRHTTLLGVTGSGKTFTVASVIARLDRPALVISHNKTLAAQLYSELKQFFPEAAVEYFVSYFDYYQPEAYIPSTDTYIEKDSSVNEEIERLRLSTTISLLSRRDVIVVASVSCIYGLGSPEDYEGLAFALEVGMELRREELLARLVEMQYERNDVALSRGRFRVRGDVVEVCHRSAEEGLRIEFLGDRIERISEFQLLTGNVLTRLRKEMIFPARHFVTPYEKMKKAVQSIREELEERVAELESQGKLLEAQRLRLRTTYDLELLEELGFCSGIENYSRHLSGRAPGSRPYTLLDFFPKDFLTVIDESHVTIPQIQGMYAGDMARKRVLVEHGFRLPSALDNRPLSFAEFTSMVGQTLYVSATPGDYELGLCGGEVVEQIIRPTGLLDPVVEVRPLQGQIDDVIEEIRKRGAEKERSLVLTLTKQTAEDLADYLRELGLRVRYLHSELDAIERVEILRGLRAGDFDVLVGINLLREGLDLPEVSLVAILDADKEGYLRSDKSLIQIAGRAARHIHGTVLLYAERKTRAIENLLEVTAYRRSKQIAYNQAHGITPRSVQRGVQESLRGLLRAEAQAVERLHGDESRFDLEEVLRDLQREMVEAAASLDYEKAALLRDQIEELRRQSGVAPLRPAGSGRRGGTGRPKRKRRPSFAGPRKDRGGSGKPGSAA